MISFKYKHDKGGLATGSSIFFANTVYTVTEEEYEALADHHEFFVIVPNDENQESDVSEKPLDEMDLKELKDKAKELNIENYSNKNKKELLALINEKLNAQQSNEQVEDEKQGE